MVLEYCNTANLDIRTASSITVCAIIAAFVIYLTSWYCKVANSELELYDVNEEHDDESLHEDCILVMKPHTTSKVWAHFGLKGNKDGLSDAAEIEKPICCHCHKTVSAKRSNTTNLFTHLQGNHPKIYAELAATKKQTNQPTLAQVIEHGKKYDASSKRAKELDCAVAYFMANNGQPFYTIEKQGFKKMVSMFDPQYLLPSRNFFAEKHIPKLYNELRDTVVKPAVIGANYYAVTTDLWTSCARHPFMSFTMHFIDDNWQLKHFVSTQYLF